MNLVPAGNRFEGDVRVAGKQRFRRRRALASEDPIVAADGAIAIVDGVPDGLRFVRSLAVKARFIFTRTQYGLAIRFGEQILSVQRTIPELPLCKLGHHDDREPAGEIPAE